MTHTASQTRRPVSFDVIGSVLLTAILLVAVALSSAEYAQVTGATGPGAVAAAFASVNG